MNQWLIKKVQAVDIDISMKANMSLPPAVDRAGWFFTPVSA